MKWLVLCALICSLTNAMELPNWQAASKQEEETPKQIERSSLKDCALLILFANSAMAPLLNEMNTNRQAHNYVLTQQDEACSKRLQFIKKFYTECHKNVCVMLQPSLRYNRRMLLITQSTQKQKNALKKWLAPYLQHIETIRDTDEEIEQFYQETKRKEEEYFAAKQREKYRQQKAQELTSLLLLFDD